MPGGKFVLAPVRYDLDSSVKVSHRGLDPLKLLDLLPEQFLVDLCAHLSYLLVKHIRVKVKLHLRLSEVRDGIHGFGDWKRLLLDERSQVLKLVRLHDAVVCGVR